LERVLVADLVDYLESDEGLQIKELDKAIKQGECTDISQEIQNMLQALFTMAKKRTPADNSGSRSKNRSPLASGEKSDESNAPTPVPNDFNTARPTE
jgi:hypothetical protein